MTHSINIGRRLVPLEQIALIEPFDPSANPNMKSERPFKARVVLLNRDSILTEETPEVFAEANGFRSLAEDGVFTNPEIHFGVEVFHPARDFRPTKPYVSRIVWRDLDGNTQSKLLLTKADDVLAIAVRGELVSPSDEPDPEPPQVRSARRRTRRRSPAEAHPEG
jgi:hypothetical protein